MFQLVYRLMSKSNSCGLFAFSVYEKPWAVPEGIV